MGFFEATCWKIDKERKRNLSRSLDGTDLHVTTSNVSVSLL